MPMKLLYASLFLLLMYECRMDFERKEVYYFGDSHFSRMDENWWFPQSINHNLAIPGTLLNEITPQYQSINDSLAICFIQIGTNSIKGAFSSGVDQELLLDSLILGYEALLQDVSAKFKKSYILSVIPVSRNYDNTDTNELGELYGTINESIDSISRGIPNVAYVNVNPILVNTETYLLEDDLTIDFLHLNNFGYQLMTGEMRKIINEHEN